MGLDKINLTGFNSCKGLRCIFPCLLVICIAAYGIYFIVGMRDNPMKLKFFDGMKVDPKDSSIVKENRQILKDTVQRPILKETVQRPILMDTVQRQIQQEFLKLLAESRDPRVVLHPVEKRCPMYSEFRRLNFLHPTLRNRLCRNVEAYKIYSDGYPMCRLPYPFDQDMLDIVRQGSEIVPLLDMQNIKIQMFVYKGPDYISHIIRSSASWESGLVHWTLRFALKLRDVTFLDMGSNIGVYSIQAAKLGLPVVSVDANIRNLLRLRLSLDAASLNADLVWNFIASDQNLKYISFLGDCNVGGAGRDKSDLPDTVPVMPIKSERVSDLIKTKNIVMKMDIQGGETDFLQTSGRLFTDFNVAAVQMEWSPAFIRGNDSIFMAKFFTDRGYKVWRVPGFTPLDASNPKLWGNNDLDIIWIHSNFLKMM